MAKLYIPPAAEKDVLRLLDTFPADLKTRRNVIVTPGAESYPLRDGFDVVGFAHLRNLFGRAL